MRESFIFYRSFWDALQTLGTRDRLKLFENICSFALDGDEKPLTGATGGMWQLLKPQLEANIRKYENGTKGGRPKTKPNNNLNETKTKPNYNLTESKPKPNDNYNDNDNDNGLGFENQNHNEKPPSLFLVSYLNEKTGGNFRPTRATVSLIDSLLEQGFTVNDIQNVIDKKAAEWSGDDRMRGFLRPSTLFGNKFAEYLAQPEPIQLEQIRAGKQKTDELRAELKEKTNALQKVRERIDYIRDLGVKENKSDYDDAKDQEQLLLARIERLEEMLEGRAV